MNQFEQYLAHGFKLCRIEPGSKGPRYAGWNILENAVTDTDGLQGAGLLHSYSGTAALDLDRMDEAAAFLSQRGIDLTDLLMDLDTVQISSGRPNRGKFLYALSDPLPSKSFANGAFELRCGTATGRSAQDVLPPSIHPGTGKPYQWRGDWRKLPQIPEALLALWKAEIQQNPPEQGVSVVYKTSTTELRDLVARQNPDCGYDEWFRIGAIIHHETEGSDEGFAIWDSWSSPSDKYPGIGVLRSHWVSFGRSAHPITANSLRRAETAAIEDFEVLPEAAETASDVPQQPARSRFLPLPELFARRTPDWIIEGVLPQTGLGAIWGQPSAGKTFIAVDMALTVALGREWQGRKVSQGSVLYIAAEDDYGVQMRFQAGLTSLGLQDAPIRVLPGAPMFTSPKDAKALLEDIVGCGPQAIIFVDTLAAVTPGSDENTSKDMGLLTNFCHRIHKASGALVILIHHEGKTPGKGMRGSSALPGAADVTIEIAEEDNHREMRISKLKNAEMGAAYPFQLVKTGKSCVVGWEL